jgi:hypothetical protein
MATATQSQYIADFREINETYGFLSKLFFRSEREGIKYEERKARQSERRNELNGFMGSLSNLLNGFFQGRNGGTGGSQ